MRQIAASNYSPERLNAALELQREKGLAEFTALQPHYNLVEREFERTLLPVADAWDLAVLPYFALAKGFLTGKYRPGGKAVKSERAEAARAYLDDGGAAVLEALDEVAGARDVPVARRRARLAAGAPARGGADRQRADGGAARADPPGGDARAHAPGGRPAVGLLALSRLREPLGIDAAGAASNSRRVSRPQPLSDERDTSEAHT